MKKQSFNPAIGFFQKETSIEKTFVEEGTHIHDSNIHFFGNEANFVVDTISETDVTLSHTVIRNGYAAGETYTCSVENFRKMVDGEFMEMAYANLDSNRTEKAAHIGNSWLKPVSRKQAIIEAVAIPANTLVSVAVMTEQDWHLEEQGVEAGGNRIHGTFIARNITYSAAMALYGEQAPENRFELFCIYKAGTTELLETLSL